MAKDPVCRMDVDESLALRSRLFAQYEEKTFYFCCEDCKDQFEQYPGVYAGHSDEAGILNIQDISILAL